LGQHAVYRDLNTGRHPALAQESQRDRLAVMGETILRAPLPR
jgi:hypothetical protein